MSGLCSQVGARRVVSDITVRSGLGEWKSMAVGPQRRPLLWPVIREGFLEEENCELCLEGERNWPGEGADEVLGPHWGGAASWERPVSLRCFPSHAVVTTSCDVTCGPRLFPAQ